MTTVLTVVCKIWQAFSRSRKILPPWFVMFCFYFISLSYFYLLRYFSLHIILQQRSNLTHYPPHTTFTVCFLQLKMVFPHDICSLRWTYNNQPWPGQYFSLWPSMCQQIPFSGDFRAPWKKHYQSHVGRSYCFSTLLLLTCRCCLHYNVRSYSSKRQLFLFIKILIGMDGHISLFF